MPTDRLRRRARLDVASRFEVAVVAAVLAWGALAFGAVYPWAYTPLAALCTIAGGVGFLRGRQRPSALLLTAFGLLIAAVLVQQIPLPRDLLTRVSPATTAIIARYDVSFALSQSAHALSIDPGRTWIGLGLLVSLGVLAFGFSAMLGERLLSRLLSFLSGLGLLIALLALVQLNNVNGRVYGLWQPASRLAKPFGPFVNRNHCAGWLLMAVLVGFGYFIGLVSQAATEGHAGRRPSWTDSLVWLSTRRGIRVLLIAFSLAAMTLAVLLSMSRSGIAALMIGLAMLGTIAVRRLRDGSRRLVVALYIAAIAALSSGWVGTDALAARFGMLGTDPSTQGRVGIWHDATAVASAFPVAGTGLNTFATSMLFYQTGDLEQMHAEAHNDYLQIAAEGGALVSIPALVLIVVVAHEIRRRFAERADSPLVYWTRVGAVTALVAIAIQETSEFSLQMPGNAALFATLVAIALHRSARVPLA